MKKIWIKYTLIILFLLPLITMIVINLNRDKLENDRNFYGKECSVDQLKVTKNGYEKYECNVTNITKKKELGKIKYDYADNVTQFELTAAEYEKYAKGVDVFYIYTPECELKYKSNNGILTAAFSGKEEYLYPHRFTENEMEGFKNVVIENSKDKIFATYAFEAPFGAGQTSEGMPKYQDKKGRKLTSDFSVSLKSADGFIEGESIIKSGKYDQLFEDKDFYQKSTTKMTGLVDKFLLFSARLNKNYPDSDVNSYFAILFSILFGYVYCFKKRDIGLIAYAILALYCMLTEFDSLTTHVIIFGAFAMALLWNSRSEEAEEGEENAEK